MNYIKGITAVSVDAQRGWCNRRAASATDPLFEG
jgi:hypothetical protein